MWNQSSGGSIGSLLQNLAQNNPQVFQAIMQMVATQRQQGVGGIGSLMPRAGMSPRGDNSMIGGPMPYGGSSDLAYRVGRDGPMPGQNRGGPPQYSGQVPAGGMWGMGGQHLNAGGGSVPSMGGGGAPSYGGFLGGPNQWYMAPAEGSAPYTPPPYVSPMPGWPTPRQNGGVTGIAGVGSGSMRSDQGGRPAAPYRAQAYNPQPTGPKYMPPTGPKTYGQTMPAEAPASFAQPKPFPQPAAQPSLAGDGTTGLDWYAMQAGN